MNEAIFSAWWRRDGQRICQSLLVATENMTVEQKARCIFQCGYEAGCRLTHGEYLAGGVSTEKCT